MGTAKDVLRPSQLHIKEHILWVGTDLRLRGLGSPEQTQGPLTWNPSPQPLSSTKILHGGAGFRIYALGLRVLNKNSGALVQSCRILFIDRFTVNPQPEGSKYPIIMSP